MTKAAELAKMGEVLTNSQIGGRRNIVINGAMQVAQRGTSVTGLGASSSGYGSLDRMGYFQGNSAGRWTMSQESDAPDGFSKSLKCACTTADTSIASNEYFHLNYALEGQDLQQLNYNTANAKTTTVSFYVKGNATASYTFIAQYHKSGGTARWFSKEIAVTTSWVKHEITIVGDTDTNSNYAIDDSNSGVWAFMFWLHGGTNYSSGTFVDGAWAERDYTNTLNDNQTSFFDSTSRTFFITGLQFEVGSQATPFEHRSFGEELQLCQRYFQKIVASSSEQSLTLASGGQAFSASSAYVYNDLPVTMRSKPSISNSISALGNFGSFDHDGSGMAISGVSIITSRSNSDRVTSSLTVASGSFTAGQSVQIDGGNLNGSFIAFDSEL